MKRFLLILGALALISCSQPKFAALISPSGSYSATTEISGAEAGPTRQLCVRLRVISLTTNKEAEFQTGASDAQKWAIDWSPKNIFVLYSSDAGIFAYDLRDGAIVERPATEEEKEIGRHAYEKKYGNKPKEPKAARPPDGSYDPDPKKHWYAGESITISGDTFRYNYFTDALPGPPERTGTIKVFEDHILLDNPNVSNRERIAGVLDGVPVLWTRDAYEAWKKTGAISELGVLYLRKK
jgi:hypothetical protein